MDLDKVCDALSQAKVVCPDAQYYGEDGRYVISLDGSSPGPTWTLGACTP